MHFFASVTTRHECLAIQLYTLNGRKERMTERTNSYSFRFISVGLVPQTFWTEICACSPKIVCCPTSKKNRLSTSGSEFWGGKTIRPMQWRSQVSEIRGEHNNIFEQKGGVNHSSSFHTFLFDHTTTEPLKFLNGLAQIPRQVPARKGSPAPPSPPPEFPLATPMGLSNF